MRRYKLAIHILVIISVFNFVPVLAAPIPMRRVREVSADAVGGGGGATILSGKRAEEGEDLSSKYRESTRASPDSGSMSDQLSTSSQYPRGSPPTSDYASGTHQETTNPIQLRSSAPRDSGMPPSEPGGTGLPWNSGGLRKPPYASGSTELPWESPNKVQPTSVRTKVVPGTGPTSSSSGRIVPASSLPQSKSFWSGLVSNSKSLFRKPFWRRRVQFTPKRTFRPLTKV